MAFRLYLSTAPDLDGPPPGATLTSPFFGAQLSFPPPGATREHVYDAPALETFPLDLGLQTPAGSPGVTLEQVGGSDTLSVLALPGHDFLGGIFHASPAAQCQARCRDGSVGSPCVICIAGASRVRICC